jgi:lipopolysaccharide export system permease protein
VPLTLYWYILREIIKLLATSVAVLVLLLAFGAAIKPISEGMLSPIQIIKVILYMVPGMLPFALPFAAAFASTLVFFRLSQDNEVTAMAVGGLSYRDILMPVLFLGLALTLGLFFMSNWVVPRFWRLVAQEIERDVASVVVKRIQSGEVVSVGGWLIYADSAQDNVPLPPPVANQPQPYNRIAFRGVAVGRLNVDRVLQDSHTAELAVMDLYRDEAQNRTYATLALSNVAINDADTGTLALSATQHIAAQEIPSPFKQKPKFLSLGELKALAQNPQASSDVRSAKSHLIQALAREAVALGMARQLEKSDDLPLVNTRGQTYRIAAPILQHDAGELRLQATDTEPVTAHLQLGDVITQRLQAQAGRFETRIESSDEEPRINLVLERVVILDPALPKPTSLREVTLPLLRYDKPVVAPLRSASVVELINLAKRYESPRVKQAAASVEYQLVNLLRDIKARLHERAASAVNCVLVLLLGAVMSMCLRRQVPLAIFFWCFMPAVAAFLTISSGTQMIGDNPASDLAGIAVTWAGNTGLIVMITLVYLRLARN